MFRWISYGAAVHISFPLVVLCDLSIPQSLRRRVAWLPFGNGVDIILARCIKFLYLYSFYQVRQFNQ